MSKYSTKCWGETYTIRADFSRPESSVEVLGEDGTWCGTQYQVAAYSTPRQAMQAVLLDSLEASGGDLEDEEEEIDKAVANVKAD